jgi:hypothetical protein
MFCQISPMPFRTHRVTTNDGQAWLAIETWGLGAGFQHDCPA